MHMDMDRKSNLISLIDPGVSRLLIVAEIFLSKPEADLMVSRVHRVRAMADVPPNLYAVVSPDGARLAVLRVGLPKHDSPSLDHALSLPAHGHCPCRRPARGRKIWRTGQHSEPSDGPARVSS